MKALHPALLLFALPAVLLGLVPQLFLYDRAAIMHGEWWRLWTGHWVHFSASHLAWNLVVLLGSGAWLEHLRPGTLLRYLPVAALLISLILLVGEPAMQSYGGLSGLATGTVTLLALVQLGRDHPGRPWWIGVLALVALKTAFDATQTVSLFSSFEPLLVRPSGLAHAAGVGTAVAFALSSSARFHSAPLKATLTAPQTKLL